MPGRKLGTDGRYGFNGKERDKDMHSLTAYDYGFRIYHPAIGKFLSVDPLSRKYPMLTPYQYASNKPVWKIDVDGLEAVEEDEMNPEERWEELDRIEDENKLETEEQWRARNPDARPYRPGAWRFWFHTSTGTQAPRFQFPTNTTPPVFSPGAIRPVMDNFPPIQRINPEIFEPSYWENAAESFKIWEEANGMGLGQFNYGITQPPMMADPANMYYTFGNQWGIGASYAVEGKTTSLLGTNQGYLPIRKQMASSIVANEENIGGFSYLENTNGKTYDLTKPEGRDAFWNEVNKPYIDKIVSRGDRIALTDNPNDVRAIYPNNGDISKGLNFFGREVEYLKSLGYTFFNGEAIKPPLPPPCKPQ